jgi:hypothetical protein
MSESRDVGWDAIYTTATRLSETYFSAIFDHGAEFELHAHRRRSVWRWNVTEGFLLIGFGVGRERGDFPSIFEPVRTRAMLSRSWHEVQPFDTAASAVGDRLREWAYHLDSTA